MNKYYFATSATIFSEWQMYYVAAFDDDNEFYGMPQATNYSFEEDDPLMKSVTWKEHRWRSIWERK